jgi:hypothetical protein
VQQESLESFVIIDGQQRLTTLTIIALAAISYLEEMAAADIESADNQQRAKLLRDSFVGTTDPASLKYSSKLSLNRNDDAFYQGTLIQLRSPHAPSRLGYSNQLLWKAFEFYSAKLHERFQGKDAGAKLAAFINEAVALRLLFVRVLVEDELSAYTVFETLNARGLDLSASDLLKNFLMAIVARTGEGDLRHVLDQWERIATTVGIRVLPEFFRHYLNSLQTPYVRQERLFKAIKSQVTTAEKAFALLDELERAALWYQALYDPSDPQWLEVPGAAEHVRVLNLFAVTQFKPLFLAAVRHFPVADLASVLRYCVVISFRYNVISDRNTNELEKIYNQVAAGIENNTNSTVAQLREALRPIYVPDDEFRDAFARKSLPAAGRSKRVARYLLCALERQLGHQDVNDETTPATIEHILPENLSPAWEANFPVDSHSRYVNRLGNYTLLDPSRNRDIGQKPYPDKRGVFQDSAYELSKRIDAQDWTPQAIDERQRKMAGWASAVWSI